MSTFFRTLLFFICIMAITATTGLAGQLRVGTWKTAQTIQPFYYQDFISEANRVSVFAFTNPADQKTALLAGSLDMCGTTVAHAIFSASKGQPVTLVAALCNKCSALVVRKDGPVGMTAELKGLKIGYVPGTMHEILLRETLTRSGLSPLADVQLVRVDFFDMGTALSRGGIDAFLSGEPFPTLAVDQGYGRILAYPYYDDTVGAINAGMLVHRDIIRKQPQQILDLVMAHTLATRYLQTHPDQWLAKAAGFGTRREILEKAAANMELAWDMDEAYMERAKALGLRMQALGVIDSQPDYDLLFDLSFVKKVADQMVP